MAELWALLHFIMPMLFDSHDEFAEWFSKDIENVAENKGSIDESNNMKTLGVWLNSIFKIVSCNRLCSFL
jgi:chromatin-remodeling ATPase INO80